MLDSTHPTLFAFELALSHSVELDRIGQAVQCARLCASEQDQAFGLRLAIHLQHSIFDREELLDRVLSMTALKRNGGKHSHE